MAFEISAKALFSDTHVSDIFIKEYLSALDGDSVKVYLFCVYLDGRQTIDQSRLPEDLAMEPSAVDRALTLLQSFGLLQIQQGQVRLCDLKEKALSRYFRLKESLDPVKPIQRRAKTANVLREKTIKHISDTFFDGQMNHVWYREIDLWFEKYKFEDAVMIMLLQHCENVIGRGGLNPKYVGTVAESWAKAGVKTVDELEHYMMRYDKYKEFRRSVTRSAAIYNLDKYQEAVLEKWFFTYQYDFDIVEEALKKSVALKNPTLATYDRYLTEWHQAGLTSKEAVIAYEGEKKKNYQAKKDASAAKNAGTGAGTGTKKSDPSGWQYEGQRQYDDAFFDALEKKAGKQS